MSKVMISLPEALLSQLDEEARRRSMSRSALLALAARRELARRTSDEIDAAIKRSEERFARAGRLDATQLIRRDRDDHS